MDRVLTREDGKEKTRIRRIVLAPVLDFPQRGDGRRLAHRYGLKHDAAAVASDRTEAGAAAASQARTKEAGAAAASFVFFPTRFTLTPGEARPDTSSGCRARFPLPDADAAAAASGDRVRHAVVREKAFARRRKRASAGAGGRPSSA
jgi:hypothetical protein